MPARRRTVLWIALVAALGLTWDLTRAPERQASARLLIGAIHVYQATLSRAMPALGVVCRFEPTCSRYAEVSIRRHGALHGSWRSVVRLARCGPWTPTGTVDSP